MRPAATVSVDVDPVDLHLVGYGHRSSAPDGSVYATALPRLSEALARARLRATFFVVARDAEAHAGSLAALIEQGHEIASHSFSHPLALGRLPAAELAHEVRDSREALERATGSEVIGFRAPNFDVNGRVVAALEAAGYRYDASAYPTAFLIPARLMLAAKSRDAREVLRLGLWPFTWRRLPHRLSTGLLEFPASVTPIVRLPIYHTLRYVSDGPGFLRRIEGVARRSEPLSYLLHAVDALGLAEDRVDPRLAPHPGMDRPLGEKLAMLDQVFASIAGHFDPLPFRERLSPGSLSHTPGPTREAG